MIIEKVTGNDLAQVYREQLFKPCQLTHTFLGATDSMNGPVAHNWCDGQNNGNYFDVGIYTFTSLYSSPGLPVEYFQQHWIWQAGPCSILAAMF